MATSPPPYSNITGISRTVMKDNAQESITNYNGNARPGEIVVDLTNNYLYIGNVNGGLTSINAGSGTVTSVSGTGTVSGLSLSGSVTSSGNLTLGGTLSLTSTNVTTALGYTPVSSAVQIFSSNFITVATTTAYNLSTTASYNILNVTAGGLTATLNMPTSPANGQITIFAVIANTVTLAVGTGTVNPSFAGGHALGTSFTYTYREFDDTWYRVG